MCPSLWRVLLPSVRASHLLCIQYISQSLLFKYAESCLRKRFFFGLLSLTAWNEWCLASLFKTEWFNNGIRPGISKPGVLQCHSCLHEQPLWFFPLVMINQTKMTVFIFWKMNLTGAFATKLVLGILSAVPRLALGAGKWVTLSLGLFAGTAGT